MASERLNPPVSERDHARGAADAPVTLVEYGDFECPFCGRAYPAVERLVDELGRRLRFVFRHFPRPEHPHARHAAEAAEAVAAQAPEAFWMMKKTLFAHQSALSDANLREYALGLGLDAQRFDHDFGQHVFRDRVHEDVLSAVASGVHATPTFFINGVKHEGPDTFDDLWAAISRESDATTPYDPVDEASEES